MRAVLDPNIIISGLLSPDGAPARTLKAWQDGRFALIASPGLLEELRRALAYPKLRKRIPEASATGILDLLARGATVVDDVSHPPARSIDPGDDYLLALAEHQRAVLVSGDSDLLDLRERFPIFTAADFLDWLDRGV
ncbi:MAG TPA: putative toxin-antitoxin system toxin component, PIN family [Solirubrobacteraceae bacterium]